MQQKRACDGGKEISCAIREKLHRLPSHGAEPCSNTFWSLRLARGDATPSHHCDVRHEQATHRRWETTRCRLGTTSTPHARLWPLDLAWLHARRPTVDAFRGRLTPASSLARLTRHPAPSFFSARFEPTAMHEEGGGEDREGIGCDVSNSPLFLSFLPLLTCVFRARMCSL